MVVSTKTQSEGLLNLLAEFEQVLIVTHDYPDPDSIASGWGIWQLVAQRLGKPVRLVGRGEVLRAENRHMLRLLKPPLELVDELHVDESMGVVLVDCGAEAKNHPVGSEEGTPAAVIDHHQFPGLRKQVAFRDVRPQAAAAASIVAAYLREQEVEPGASLATAMLYAIRTETCGGEACHSPLDRAAVVWLTARANLTQLAEIESAPLRTEYFSDMALALQNTFVYDGTALCLLPSAHGPEIVGEVADLLVRCDEVQCVCCGAIVGNDCFLSVRTERLGDNAAELALKVVEGLGHGGGHEHRAGGKIAGVGRQGKMSRRLETELRNRWLAACGVEQQRGTRLVPRREIVDNL